MFALRSILARAIITEKSLPIAGSFTRHCNTFTHFVVCVRVGRSGVLISNSSNDVSLRHRHHHSQQQQQQQQETAVNDAAAS